MQRVPGGVSGWLAERAALTGKKSGKKSAGKKSDGKKSDGMNSTGSAKPKPAGPSSGGGKPKAARTGPSASTIGRQLREAEQAMVKTQKRVDTLAGKLSGLAAVDELLAVGNQLSAAQIELDELEATWLELAEQSEG
jgi:ATP-binding cassette subfamily F protein uup